MEVSEVLKCANLNLLDSDFKGRSVVAKQNFSAGETLLRGQPYAYALNAELWDIHCFNCFRRELKSATDVTEEEDGVVLRLCSRCRTVNYCSVDCQRIDWEAHKVECKSMRNLKEFLLRGSISDSLSMITETVLLARTIRKMYQTVSPKMPTTGPKLHNIPNDNNTGLTSAYHSPLLSSPTSDIPLHTGGTQNDILNLCKVSSLAHESKDCMKHLLHYRLLPKDFPVDKVADVLARFQCNNFEICDSHLHPLGFGVYPVGSMFNHSCVPNSIALYEPNSHIQVIRTISNIRAGEELCHSYTELAAPFNVRQMHLNRLYEFHCNCKRCVDGLKIKLRRGDKSEDICQIAQNRENDICHLECKLGNDARTSEHCSESEQLSGDFDVVNMDDLLLADVNGCDVSTSKLPDLSYNLQTASMISERDGSLHNVKSQLSALVLVEPFLHECNLQLYSLRGKVLSAALDSGNLEVAVSQSEKVVAFLKVVYCHVGAHPMLGLNLITQADIYYALENYRKSMTVCKEALRIMKVCYGCEHEFVILLETKLALLSHLV